MCFLYYIKVSNCALIFARKYSGGRESIDALRCIFDDVLKFHVLIIICAVNINQVTNHY